MAERRQRAALDEANLRVGGSPGLIALPRELGAEAEPGCDRHQRLFDLAAHAVTGADAGGDDDLAAGPDDPNEFVERHLRIGYRGDDILRDHDIERVVVEV